MHPHCSAAFTLFATLLIVGCAHREAEAGSGLRWVSRPRSVSPSILVIHHTAVDLPTSLRILSGLDPERRVSSHYLVTDESPPRVIPLVPVDRVAFHAGASHWRGASGLNETSLGIEVVNLDGNLHDYPEAQVEALAKLVLEVARRHGVRPRDIVAHAEIAPGRKVDPGTRFPWERLHRRHGIGTWPSDEALAAEQSRGAPLPSPEAFRQLLAAWGYPVGVSAGWDAADGAALAAFQRRYRPSKVDGQPDRECADLLRALLATYPESP